MKYILSFLLCCTALAQQTVNNFAVKTNLTVSGAQAATKADTVAAMKALVVTQDKMQVSTLGYYSIGDGGNANYYFNASSTATPDNGSVIQPLSGSGRFLLIPEDSVKVRQFGAKGDSSTDDTSACQAAINYAQTGILNKFEVVFDPGIYVISSIVCTNVSLVSYYGKIGNGGSPLAAPSGATLLHASGATNDMVILRPLGNPMPAVKNIRMIGRRETNLKNPITISSVASRLSFTVPTNNLPVAPASPSVYPYYGYCFMFSPQNRYLGAGLVSNINYTTGVITLYNGSDEYATPTGSSYLLLPGYKVCFSQTTTEYANFATTTGVDSTTAGYSAINLTATRTNLISEVLIEDVKVSNFHTGLRLGNNLFTYINRFWGFSCSFASAATAFPGDSRDGVQSGIFLQGFYDTDPGNSGETNTFENSAYRATLFGYYGVESSAAIDDIRADHTVHGFYFQDDLETQINQMLTDNTVSHALIIGPNFSTSSRIDVHIADLQIRNINSSSYSANTTNLSFAIYTWGDNNQFLIDALSVVRFGSVDYFDAVFEITGIGNRIVSDNLFTSAGATNLFSASSTSFPMIVADTRTSGTIDKYIGGTNQFGVDATTSATQLPIRINYNGTFKRVEVGAVDSGGVGYRLLRITN